MERRIPGRKILVPWPFLLKALPIGQQALRVASLKVYVDSLGIVWIVMYAFACVAFYLALTFTKEFILNWELVTEQGFRHGARGRRTEVGEIVMPRESSTILGIGKDGDIITMNTDIFST
jgi:hypothetical protein